MVHILFNNTQNDPFLENERAKEIFVRKFHIAEYGFKGCNAL